MFLWAKKASWILEDKDYWNAVQRPLKDLKLKKKWGKQSGFFLLIYKWLSCFSIIKTLLPSKFGATDWSGRSGQSKCVITQVQFGAGQTGALLTVTTVR